MSTLAPTASPTATPGRTCPPIIEQSELKSCRDVRCDEQFFYGKCAFSDYETQIGMADIKDCENKNGTFIFGRGGKIICTDKPSHGPPWWAILLFVLTPILVVAFIALFLSGSGSGRR